MAEEDMNVADEGSNEEGKLNGESEMKVDAEGEEGEVKEEEEAKPEHTDYNDVDSPEDDEMLNDLFQEIGNPEDMIIDADLEALKQIQRNKQETQAAANGNGSMEVSEEAVETANGNSQEPPTENEATPSHTPPPMETEPANEVETAD